MNINRMSTRPLDVPRSMRRHGLRVLTSLPAGKVVPLAAVPLLREDAVRSGRMQFAFEMSETAELLMNAVYVDVKAYLVPWLAFARFNGSMDIFNRSYKGQPPMEGEEPIAFFETVSKGSHGDEEIYKYLGLHAQPDAEINTAIAEAYNAVWNFRARNRSRDIAERDALDTSLAPAFWRHTNFAHIVPDFDQAVIDGEVALNVVEARMPVTGIGIDNTEGNAYFSTYTRRESGGRLVEDKYTPLRPNTGGEYSESRFISVREDDEFPGFPGVYAELQENGITVSLSNIELARKTQAFARLREQYSQHDDEWIIDMLMDGLTIPDQALKQPMLLAEASNVFGMNKRYSTDADALTASAVNGATSAQLKIRLPRLMTGGVIMVTAEITPEQLFERQKDPFFHLGSVEELPEYLRDTLDPEKVEIVTNDFVDVDHESPNDTFGYAPLNHKWTGVHYRVGGKFYRPEVDALADEDRQRLWAVETQNPVLSEDFYLCTTMHQKPFLDNLADPFEAVAIGEFRIEGNTVFGPVLVEAMNNYDEVMEKAPTERIDKSE